MDQDAITLTLLGMMAVTALPRILPLWLLASRRPPEVIEAWLRYVPVAVLAAMLLPSLLMVEGHLALRIDNLYLWAALPTLWVAIKTKSLFGSVVLGMAIVAMARWALGWAG